MNMRISEPISKAMRVATQQTPNSDHTGIPIALEVGPGAPCRSGHHALFSDGERLTVMLFEPKDPEVASRSFVDAEDGATLRKTLKGIR